MHHIINTRTLILIKMAWRNLRVKPKETLALGILTALGVAMLVVGSSLTNSISTNIRETYIDNFTSDMIVRNHADEDESTVDFIATPPIIPTINSYPQVAKYLEQHPQVKQFTPVLHAKAEVTFVEGVSASASLWGIQPTNYFDIFPESFTLTEGSFWKEDETGVVLEQGLREAAKRIFDVDLHIGDMITLTATNINTGTKIRQVPIRGFGHFNNFITEITNVYWTDASTIRYLVGETLYQDNNMKQTNIASVSEDTLFSSNDFVEQVLANQSTLPNYEIILGDTSRREKFFALDNHAWHFIVVESKGNIPLWLLQKNINNYFQKNNHISQGIRIENWRWGAKGTFETVKFLQMVFNIAIGFITAVAIVVIINALVITINQRTSEIGTMRALGGQKNFVSCLIIWEILMITILFGIIGIFIGSLIIFIIYLYGIPANNIFLMVLFSGETLRPTVSITSLGFSFLATIIIGVTASLYPIRIALNISPARAMESK